MITGSYKNGKRGKVRFYLSILVLSFLFVIINEKGKFDLRIIIGTISFTSILVLLSYFMLKHTQFRFLKLLMFYRFINRLHMSGKEISFHLGIAFISFVIAGSLGAGSNSQVTHEKIDPTVLKTIETQLGRQDIIQITKIDNKYIIKLSDDSLKIVEIE